MTTKYELCFKHIHSYNCKFRQFVFIEVFKLLKLQGLRTSLRGREALGLTFSIKKAKYPSAITHHIEHTIFLKNLDTFDDLWWSVCKVSVSRLPVEWWKCR